jgi:hypothetical protein
MSRFPAGEIAPTMAPRNPVRRRPASASSQPTALQRVREGGVRQLVLVIPAAYVLAAIVLAWGMLTVDGAVGDMAVPDSLRFGEENARSLLTSLTTAYLTVVALVFWVRMLAVQQSSDEFPSRILREFLTDAIQQHVMGFILGGLTYGLVVTRAVPDGGAGMPSVASTKTACSARWRRARPWSCESASGFSSSRAPHCARCGGRTVSTTRRTGSAPPSASA